ncbi:MAG: hypothetical protein V2I97_16210 [Desulfococcaceae bacterium]|jgi:hypothetical protein|nr:hypothetical protein [Desulfococcaceae bacterium]
MMNLKDIKNNRHLLNEIDWNMTPEEAVRLYLEWGCNWARSNYVIRSKNDTAHYFVVNTWKEKPVIYFIRRNSEQAEELAKISMPKELEDEFLDSVGHNKGVFSIEGEVRDWLQKELGYHA